MCHLTLEFLISVRPIRLFFQCLHTHCDLTQEAQCSALKHSRQSTQTTSQRKNSMSDDDMSTKRKVRGIQRFPLNLSNGMLVHMACMRAICLLHMSCASVTSALAHCRGWRAGQELQCVMKTTDVIINNSCLGGELLPRFWPTAWVLSLWIMILHQCYCCCP